MAGEHLVVGTVGMVTTDEVRTTMTTVMTDGVTDHHGTPEIITRRVVIGVITEVLPRPPTPKNPN